MLRLPLAGVVLLAVAGAVSSASAQQGQIGANPTMVPLGVITHIGRRVSYVCPAISQADIGAVDVWGTDVYMGDSPICVAAVHAGALRAGQAGVVTILISSGADTFTGSARNGVTSKESGPFGTSYSFDRTGAPGQIDWATNALGIPETFTASIALACPGGGAMTGMVWGSDVYLDDSSICTAAVHAGLITRASGGNVFITRATEQADYPSTERNGVKSIYWSGPSAAFRVGSTSTAIGGTAINAPTAVVGTVTPPPPPPPAPIIQEPMATPIVRTTICSPGQISPGPSPATVRVGTYHVSPVGADLTWTVVSGAAGYVVERLLASGGTPTRVGTTCENPEKFVPGNPINGTPTVFFRDRSGGLQANKTYAYMVKAFGSGGQMGWNSIHWTAPVPPGPTIYPPEVTGSTVKLTWSSPSSIDDPTDFLVTSEYGYSQVVAGHCSCSHIIQGVPIGAHTFTVQARWPPDVTASRSTSATITP